MIRKLFIEHCHDTGETYFQHLLFTIKTAATLVYSGFALIIHGVFPFLFTTTASTNIKKLNTTILTRSARASGDNVTPMHKKAA
ncbi:MAG: hypothetical protein K0R10_1823 [Alphaproteobacteria bacterium]|mgnify:CR=1 FL=1|jgi:hypothetical protein|nr:hypothetical protein [Alphaproteobacteria bacterium]